MAVKLVDKLQKNSGIALWRQVADRLRQDMNMLADGQGRLPPELALADHFSVNRLTLRTAVTALVDEGLLSREQGRGTFIKKQMRLKYPISKRTRFSSGFAKQADERSVSLVNHIQEPATKEVSEMLELSEHSKVVRLETLSFADNIPVIRSTSWFPANCFETIGDHVETTGSITDAFRLLGVGDYIRRSTEVEADHASISDLIDLNLSPGAICLVTTSINEDLEGVPIQYSISRMAANRVTLTISD